MMWTIAITLTAGMLIGGFIGNLISNLSLVGRLQKQINMRYLVTMNGHAPFYTNWFLAESHFIQDCGMVVYDLDRNVYTNDGKDWKVINQDKL